MRDRVPGPVLSLPSSAARKSTHHRTRDDNRGATRQVPASNPRRSDSGSHPSHSSSKTRDGGSLTATTAKLLEQVPSNRNPRGARVVFGIQVPSFPSRHQPRRNQPATEPATTTATLLDRSLPPIREDQIPSPTPRARHQDAGWRIHRQAERSLTATTAKLLEQVPSHRTHGEPALFGFRVPSFPSRHQPRRINPPPTERPNPPREDQGPSPPAGPHAFTCSRPGVTFPSPPCNRNST